MHHTSSYPSGYPSVVHLSPADRHRRVDGALIATMTFAMLVLATGLVVFLTAG